ncbi:MAG: DNA recombination/repair protein RecA, partial [Anaerolineaceae bacterium]|nr:DNA recombination/repair protein RecA [Anaerolineaceae bacterium]
MARKSNSGIPTNIEKPNTMHQMDDAKRAVLDKALGDIVKRYGEGSI